MLIEFLYYDKHACSRCASTDKAVRLTLKSLEGAMRVSGLNVELKERRLPLSEVHRSPTVLIDGTDIEALPGSRAKTSSPCQDCCKLAGRPVKCRAFTTREVATTTCRKGW